MQRHTSNRDPSLVDFSFGGGDFSRFRRDTSLFAQTRLLFQSRGHKVSEAHCDSRVVLPLFFFVT
jgi:hypothetical protein